MREFAMRELATPVPKRTVTKMFRPEREDHGTLHTFSMRRYPGRTQVLNAATHEHQLPKDVLVGINENTWSFFGLKTQPTLWDHLKGMRDQGSEMFIDGVLFEGNGYDFRDVPNTAIVTLKTDPLKWKKRTN